MARKLIDIEKEILSKSEDFLIHLEKSVSKEVLGFILDINKMSNVYIFSGIIRNFFLKRNEIRDIDIILESVIDIESLLHNYQYSQNSFGGYKIYINEFKIDLWYLKKTWALNHDQGVFDFYLPQFIPSTSFFNFSAILFSLKEKKFIVKKDFVRFLRDKTIDIVYEPNPNEILCIINSFYYIDKYNLKPGKSLIKYILKKYKGFSSNYELYQIKHFGSIIFTSEDIEKRVESIRKQNELISIKTHTTFSRKRPSSPKLPMDFL